MSLDTELNLQMSIASTVRQKRISLGLSQLAAAKQAGISRQLWSDIEHGKRQGGADTLAKIDAVLDLPAGSLFAMLVSQPTESLAAMRKDLIAMINELTLPQVAEVRREALRQEAIALRERLASVESELKDEGREGRP